MQRSIGNETRFRVLNTLVETGPQHASELRDGLETRSNTVHYHLDELADVGLVENRKRKDPDSDGLYSYYRATSLRLAELRFAFCEWTLNDSSVL